MSRKTPVKFHCACGRRWDGTEQAHCRAQCHRHSGSAAAFDLHRQGSVDARFCADPATIVWGAASKYVGKPRMRAAEGPHGVTWVLTVQNSLYGRPERRGDAAVSVHEQAVADVRGMFERAFGHGP